MRFRIRPGLALINLVFAAGCAGGPLVNAAGSGDLQKVTELLDQGADIQKSDEGSDPCATPLASAAENGRDAVIKELLKRGANVNAICAGANYNALICAGISHQESAVRLLLASGAIVTVAAINQIHGSQGVVFVSEKDQRINAMLKKALADQRARVMAPPPPTSAAEPRADVHPAEPTPLAEKPWWDKGDSK